MKDNRIIFLSMIILFLFIACTITNKYGPYYGKVIDAETKQPIEGAAVLVVYKTEQYGLAGAISHFADAQETLTDKNGEFKIPAKRINTFRIISGWERYPGFWIFKPEYGCYPEHKDVKPMFVPNGTLPENEYVIIELPKLKTREERLNNEGCFPVGVPDKKMRKLIKISNDERINLGLTPYPKSRYREDKNE